MLQAIIMKVYLKEKKHIIKKMELLKEKQNIQMEKKNVKKFGIMKMET